MARIKKLSSLLVAALALGAVFAATGTATPDVPARAASVPQAVAASSPQKCASSSKTTTRLVYGPRYYSTRSGFAAGQPAGGYRFQYGGSLQFQQSSGGNASFNFSLGAPWGQVGFSLPLGRVSTGYTGLFRHHPEKQLCFLQGLCWLEDLPRPRVRVLRVLCGPLEQGEGMGEPRNGRASPLQHQRNREEGVAHT